MFDPDIRAYVDAALREAGRRFGVANAALLGPSELTEEIQKIDSQVIDDLLTYASALQDIEYFNKANVPGHPPHPLSNRAKELEGLRKARNEARVALVDRINVKAKVP